jgi:hypothetical protein
MKKLIVFIFIFIFVSLLSYGQDLNMTKYTIDKNKKVTRKECYQSYYTTDGRLVIRPTVNSIVILTKITDKEWKDENRKIWDRFEKDGIMYYVASEKLAYYYQIQVQKK